MEIFGIHITDSQVAIFLGLLTSFLLGLITLWWKIKTFWFDREQQFIRHVQQTVAAQNALQTAELEVCIHRTPGHPENSTKVPDSPDSVPGD